MRKWMAVGALAFAFVAADQPSVYAQDDAADGAAFVDENGNGIDDAAEMRHRFGGRRMFGVVSQLTDEQRVQLKGQIESLKASDASREEIHEAVSATLEGFGIERPDAGDRLSSRFGDALTEDQITDLTDTITDLRDSGATHEEVRAAVDAKLTELGVERPTFAGREGKGFGRRGRRGGRFGGPPPADAPAEDAN
jgi:hypothetical protein